MSGVKVVRGYSEPKKAKDDKRPSTPTGTKSSTAEADEKQQKMLKRRSAPPSTKSDATEQSSSSKDEDVELESRQNFLTRKLSNLLETDPEEKEKAIREQEQDEIEDDYNPGVGETQGREIEHLVLVTHGIGQLLSLK